MLALGHLSSHSRSQLLKARRCRKQQAGADEQDGTEGAPASPAKGSEEGAEAPAEGATPSFPALALAGAIARMYHDDLLPLLPLQGAWARF